MAASDCSVFLIEQFVIFKRVSYYFKEAIRFDIKALFVSRPVSRLIRWYNKPDDTTKEFWEKAIQFHGTFHGLKITNWEYQITCCNKKIALPLKYNDNANINTATFY